MLNQQCHPRHAGLEWAQGPGGLLVSDSVLQPAREYSGRGCHRSRLLFISAHQSALLDVPQRNILQGCGCKEMCLRVVSEGRAGGYDAETGAMLVSQVRLDHAGSTRRGADNTASTASVSRQHTVAPRMQHRKSQLN